MFSTIIENVVGYLTGGSSNDTSDDHSDDISDVTEKNDSDNDNLEEKVYPTANSDEESGSDTENDILEKTIHGIVTSYFNNRGLIDDSIYFTQDIILGNDQPRVGDEVLVKASRSHSSGGWVALTVQITALWHTEEEESNNKPYKDTIIGVVIKLFGNSILIKTTLEYNIPLSKFKAGYKPYNGDWISIEIWNKGPEHTDFSSSSFSNDIISISPLREKKIVGTVTDILSRNGLINGDIYFSFAICKRGTFFKRGDKVVALVIEAKQTKGNWRAVYIEHCKKDENKNSGEGTANDASTYNGVSVTKEIVFGNLSQTIKYKKDVSIRYFLHIAFLHEFIMIFNTSTFE